MKARAALLPIHRWVGLCFGVPLVLVAVTGATMAFRPQLDPFVDPALLRVPACRAPLPLDTLVDAARKANPSAGELRFVRLYHDAPARVRFSDGRWVYLDPCNARVTGIQALYGGPYGAITNLHILGFLGDGHDNVAGSLATLFALAMLGVGTVLWWPTSLRALTRPRGLHKKVAMFAAPLLLVSASTGIPQGFGWGQLTPAQAAGNTTAPLEAMWRRAQALVPASSKLQLRLAGSVATFEIVAGDAPHANAFSYATFNGHSGELTKFVPYAENSAAHKAYLLAAAVHYGWVGGVAGQLLLMFGALSVPVLAWTGTAAYLRRPKKSMRRVRIVRKREEADGVASFELAAADGKPLPAYTAGAHIDVYPAPGFVRQYSLCGQDGRYRIAVLHTPNSRGGSRAMHQLKEGDVIEIGTPRNHFPLTEAAPRSLLLAGGIGITPILAMAERLHALGAPFEMHYCARSAGHAAFHEYLRSSAYAKQVTFHFERHMDFDTVLAKPGAHLYVCGPAGFMDAVLDAARRLGWPEEQLHREYFAGAVPSAQDDTAFTLELARSGMTVEVAPGQSAVEALAAAGVEVPTSCGHGVCGTCVTRLLAGEPDHRDQVLTKSEKADWFTPCCSRARSGTLTIDL